MNTTEKIINEFESQVKSFASACTSDEQFKECCEDVLELLKSQCDLNWALEESNAVNRRINAEVERLQKENEDVKNRLRMMYNRCISFRGAADCGDCVQKEKCESTRNMWRGWHLKNRERVMDGEQA